MSEVRVNKISPRSGTTVTLGDNGDTITIPSGVTLDASSGGLAGTLTTAAQPNITSVGTLTSFTSTGIDDNATSTAITINSSEQVAFTDGTASLPSITNLGDENTGMFFPVANEIGFATNGSETVRINATGAMSLGTNTIADKLHVFNNSNGTNTGTGIRLGQGYNSAHTRISSNFGGSVTLDAGIGAGQPEIFFKTNNIIRQKLLTNGDVYFYEDTGTTAKFIWDSSTERLGIGASPSDVLHLYKSSDDSIMRIQWDASHAGKISFREGGTETGQIEMHSPTDAVQAGNMLIATTSSGAAGKAIVFQTNSAEAMRIDSSGNLKFNSGFGSVATAYGVRAWVNFNGTGAVAINGSGNVTSITDSGTGDYRINFTINMPNTNYSAVATATKGAGGPGDANSAICNTAELKQVSTYSLNVHTTNGTQFDSSQVSTGVFL
jgi:hypothetical protein